MVRKIVVKKRKVEGTDELTYLVLCASVLLSCDISDTVGLPTSAVTRTKYYKNIFHRDLSILLKITLYFWNQIWEPGKMSWALMIAWVSKEIPCNGFYQLLQVFWWRGSLSSKHSFLLSLHPFLMVCQKLKSFFLSSQAVREEKKTN